MSFRIKLRVKSYKTNPELLARLVEAAKREAATAPPRYQEVYDRAKRWPRGNDCVPVDDWRRSWHGNLPYRGPNTCFLWNGVGPINWAGVQ